MGKKISTFWSLPLKPSFRTKRFSFQKSKTEKSTKHTILQIKRIFLRNARNAHIFSATTYNSNSRLCDGDACNVDWTPVPNMGAALQAFNPYKANDVTNSYVDPGWGNQIFSPTYVRFGWLYCTIIY